MQIKLNDFGHCMDKTDHNFKVKLIKFTFY